MRATSFDFRDNHSKHNVSQKSFKQPKTDRKENRHVSNQGRQNSKLKKSPKNRNSRSMMGHYNVAVDRSLVVSHALDRKSPLLTSNSMINLQNNHSMSRQKRKNTVSRDSKRHQKPQLAPPYRKGLKRTLSKSMIKMNKEASFNVRS